MRAVVFTGAGENEVVSFADRPDPVPGGDDILLDVRFAALNPADLAQRAGRYPAPPGSPVDIPGIEVAGTVISTGPARAPSLPVTGSSGSLVGAGWRIECLSMSAT